MKKTITIKENESHNRLDKILVTQLPELTRSQIQKMIKHGIILVNNKPAKVHEFLKAGDTIIIDSSEGMNPIKKPTTTETPMAIIGQPKIIFENDDFIVIEKPSGMLTHPTDKGETDTLVDWLANLYPEIEKIGEYKYRGGIIHRLDREVSGVMVAAKSEAGFYHLKKQFKERKVKKIYLALVYGRIEDSNGEINLPIGRNKDGQFVAHPRQGKLKFLASDKIAKTKYKVLEYIKDYSLVEVKILTGRTHQIRAHFYAIGHPILGDQIYKPKKKFFTFLRRKIKVINPKRIFLHSQQIGFYNLNNQWVEFNSSLPEILTEFINDQKNK
ncbi:MAG: RluA family pseudouridine synthase [Patescibacteria group bacterium]|jgi:23S rRNA pseudouridine1911/1915/1917 synthase|nr:RluA family pseudouridine synthase [Patescibacteria group bacterium]